MPIEPASPETASNPGTALAPCPTPSPARARPTPLTPWSVILLDDDDHSYEYVIQMVQRLFGHPREAAYGIAKAVDSQGRAVCYTTHKELAELKRDQILAFGADPTMARSAGSMSAVIEPACAPGDDNRAGGDQPPSKP